jgi:uridine kinase
MQPTISYNNRMEEIAKHCFDRIIAEHKRPLFVAIGGDSGSGKSYLTAEIEKHFKQADLSYTLINHDEFLISRKDREPMKSTYYQDGEFAGKSHWEILENMFRLDEYERVIRDLKAGRSTEFHPYSRDTGTVRSKTRKVTPTDFILFDTSMMLDKMDFVILVDVTQENILKRKLVRDSDVRTPEQIKEMHQKVQAYYWEDRGKPTDADIIIDNNDFANVRLVKG